MRSITGALTLALVLAIGGAVAAHHAAAEVDLSKSVKISGIVKKFQAINPHMRLTLEVTDEKGTRDIEFEGHSTNNMYRAGYRNGMIKVGDRITVYYGPMRNGSDGGYVTAAETAKGEAFGMGQRGGATRGGGAAPTGQK
jgi:hypothetical protein